MIWYGISKMSASFMGLDIYIVTKYERLSKYYVESEIVGWFPTHEGALGFIDTQEAQ